MVHVSAQEYGESGVLSECFVCGTWYDKGDHPCLQRPCPTCGARDLQAGSYSQLVNMVVGHLIHEVGLTNMEIAEAVGVKPGTLKAWRYKRCGPDQFDRFSKGVRRLLTKINHADQLSSLELVERFGGWENVFFINLGTTPLVATINDGLLRAVIVGVDPLDFDSSLGESGSKGAVLVRWYLDGERLVEKVSQGYEPNPFPNTPIEIAVSSPATSLRAIKEELGIDEVKKRITKLIEEAVNRFLNGEDWVEPFISPEVEEAVFVAEPVTADWLEEVLF